VLHREDFEDNFSSDSHIPTETPISAFLESKNLKKTDHKLFIPSMCPPLDQWELKNHLQRHLALGHI